MLLYAGAFALPLTDSYFPSAKFPSYDLSQQYGVARRDTILLQVCKKLREELVKTFNELAKDVFLFRIKENESVLFDKRLVGERDCFYELKFYCFSLGYDGIKIRIEITRFGFDSPYPGTKMPSQDLFLGEHKPTEKINYIPWTVTLVKTHGKTAVISIEKQ